MRIPLAREIEIHTAILNDLGWTTDKVLERIGHLDEEDAVNELVSLVADEVEELEELEYV